MNKISTHLALWEVECPCGCRSVEEHPDIMDNYLIQGFERVRGHVNRPVHVNSGYRCPSYQAKRRAIEIETKKELFGMTEEELVVRRLIWHSLDSPHCKGLALDIRVDGLESIKLFAIVIHKGFTGVGLYPWGCHVDPRPVFTTWARR